MATTGRDGGGGGGFTRSPWPRAEAEPWKLLVVGLVGSSDDLRMHRMQRKQRKWD